ncbi:extensin family protein [Devosia sp. FJ2-5-3]|uniref:extensin-like domain-containing protein n=1 Tax=Devosia sp. FJ2-5-3 TaxID=2976680 RepID=UPI0023D82399|nr:extensin family protein [Devosia sp. FJ2-5-3]WEJ58412.1 extensin family protein [Devosia sp. FJ2-5-3]
MRTAIATLALLACLGIPAAAQDFLKPLEEFVETIVPPRTPAPRAQPAKPEPAAPAVRAEDEKPAPPPIPRPRPETLNDQEAEAPAPEAVEDAQEAEPAPDAEAAPEKAVAPEAPAVASDDRIYQTACPALLSGKVVGEMLEPIAEGICGERSPLSVTAVNVNGHQIDFSAGVTTNCEMAGALADWVGAVDAYANAALDSPLASLETGTSMMCRGRNGNAEAATSEHGFANALDVTGFTLEDGRRIAVEPNWLPAAAPEGKMLRQAHGAACGLFTTVLGPEANDSHNDHFHLDLGCHGQSCTAQICE